MARIQFHIRRAGQFVLGLQGIYYAITGIWPLVSLATFEAVTGPKTDDWLVKTVGALVLAIAIALLVGARLDPPSAETFVLGIASAVAFAAVDVVYVLENVVRPIYLADAAVEAVIASILTASWISSTRRT
jgi:hypothetical protein